MTVRTSLVSISLASALPAVLVAACAAPPPQQREGIQPHAETKARQPPESLVREAAPRERERSKDNIAIADRVKALGSALNLDSVSRAAYSSEDFEPLPKPKTGEWLEIHRERGQSYAEFLKGRRIRPDDSRDTLYVLPLGNLKESGAPAGKQLVAFAKHYFGVKAKLLRPIDPTKLKLTWRKMKRSRQLHARSVIEMLKKRLPTDAFAMIAVTGHDLYPDDDWNFVFGMATFRERVGVYSTARYNPTFYDTKVALPNFDRIVLRRTLNIMAHEIGHMFGLEHCVYYRCAMNGSNSLAETDRSPIHLCPVCLRKLRHSVGFDLLDRYRALKTFYRQRGLESESKWLGSRLERIESTPLD